MRVFHEKFGEGTVMSQSNEYSTVIFDQCGKQVVKTPELKEMIFG